jgi:hypothetical protein
MTKSSDTPSDKRENTEGTPQTAPPYPYQHHYSPGPYAGGYPLPPPYYGYPPPTGPRNGLGATSLALAITALLVVWSVVGGIILGLTAVVTGFLARGRVKRGTANNGGVATAGIVLGALAVIVGVVFIPIWMALWNNINGGDYVSCMQNAGPDRVKRQHCVDRFREHIEDRLSIKQTPSSSSAGMMRRSSILATPASSSSAGMMRRSSILATPASSSSAGMMRRSSILATPASSSSARHEFQRQQHVHQRH